MGLDDVGDLRFDSQQGGLDGSVPDVKCIDDKGRLRVVVENKFWAGLTENQPVTYIRELPVGLSALVLFVVPESRLLSVWNEVVARCKDAGIVTEEVEGPVTARVANIGLHHRLAATSWNVLLDSLSMAAASAGEVGAQNDIAQLRGLCTSIDDDAFLPLRSDELTNLEVARRLNNLCDLPSQIVEAASVVGLCDKKKESPFRYGSGTYIRIGPHTAWVGFAANLWRSHAVSPIWVNFYPEYSQPMYVSRLLSRFAKATPRRCFEVVMGSYRFVAVPIFLSTGVEKQRVIQDAVHQLRELKAELIAQDAEIGAAVDFHTEEANMNPSVSPSTGQPAPIVETILEVGAEGGSIRMSGKRDAAEAWSFWTEQDESTIFDLLDAEDLSGFGGLVKTTEPASSLAEAFALLGERPWFRLYPLQIHPEFRLAIRSEVQKRATPEELAMWDHRDPSNQNSAGS